MCIDESVLEAHQASLMSAISSFKSAMLSISFSSVQPTADHRGADTRI